jgi:predicted Zn-dependent peptidase
LCLLAAVAAAQNLPELEKRIGEFTLENGLHFIVMERREAPVVSFHTYVNAGSVFDPSGSTGIAHMFEHMAFKGTETIGSRNWPEEKKALEAVEEAYDRLDLERRKVPRGEASKSPAAEAQLKVALSRANTYAAPNAWPNLVEENGGAGLNAQTGLDATEYYFSLPSNRIELFFLLESQRFLSPVFREFYKERDVVLEEYRARVESNPQGRLLQAFSAAAFAAHPYRRSGAGWPSDIEGLRARDAERFFKTYYVPSNITIAVVGDADTAHVRQLARKYFSALPAAPPPPLLGTRELRQQGPRQVVVESPAQPLLYAGFKRPDQYHRDGAVFDVIGGLLGAGRTSLLYKEMVRDRKIALGVGVQPTFPGGRFENLFVFFVAPSRGSSVAENEKVLYELIERFGAQLPEEQAMRRVKTILRAGLIRQLDSNPSVARLLATAHGNYGSWKRLLTALDDIDKVAPADVQRVARQYLVPSGRTVAFSVPPPAGAGK